MASDSSLGSSAFIPESTNTYNSNNYNPGSQGGYDNTPTQTNQYPNEKINVRQIGLRDKYDASSGLAQTNANDVQQTTVEYTVTVDTRDCVGMNSLKDAQDAAVFNGVRSGTYGVVLNASNTSPITLTLDSVLALQNGDEIEVTAVKGNLNANGSFIISNVTVTASPIGTVTLNDSYSMGIYTGGGEWNLPSDPGYPLLSANDSVVKGNQIIMKLNYPIRNIRTFALNNIVIPRDIIPLPVYIKDFIDISTTYTNTSYPGLTETNYTTYIPQERKYLEEQLLGFYSSPLSSWRSYRNGSISMADQVTPPPLGLWNPPVGDWPLQPVPYPFQTVPTYKSNNFTVSGQTGTFHLILSGYGVYDLIDWTAVPSGDPIADATTTSLMRKLLFFLIVQKQSYRDIDYVDLIINCNTVTPGDYTYPFGYGDFQRFVCGPGYQLNYQPGTNTSLPEDPTIASTDSPVPFPDFRGNVCGPYNYPGCRFQKIGLVSVIQDLYLNGDLANLHGQPIILANVPTEAIPEHPSFGLNFLSLVEVNLGNYSTTTNINILNAMRIVPNGFGALTVRANGQGIAPYTSIYGQISGLGAGGQGPSINGYGQWVNRGIYGTSGSLSDPIAQGPLGSNITPPSSDASYPGVGAIEINYNTAFYDSGPNFGNFINSITNYINFAVNDIPDTDIIVKVLEANRTRAQSTNSNNSYAILDCPIRLNIGSANGTQQYIESVQSLVSGASFYWKQRFITPIARLDSIHISFTTYDGTEIPLEKMLQQRRSLELQQLTTQILNNLDITTTALNNIAYLFDPLNPKLIGRLTRYISIIFNIEAYEASTPGLLPESYTGIAPYIPANSEIRPYS